MRNVLILFVFIGLFSFSAMPSKANSMVTGSGEPSISLCNPFVGASNSVREPLLANLAAHAMDLNRILIMSDTPTLADTSAANESYMEDTVQSDITTQIGDVPDIIIDWLSGTAWPYIENLIGSGISSGVSSIGGTIESWGDDVASWFGTRHGGPRGGFSTLSTPTTDTSVVFSDGMGTKGIVIGSALGLLGTANGGTVVVDSTLGQNTTYTIPDPGTTSAKFVLDQGNQSFSGSRTFNGPVTLKGNVTVSSLSANQVVTTNGSMQLTSLAYGSTNTASTLVERDASGNFSGAAITATHVLSSGSAQAATDDGTIVTSATASGSDVSGTITLTTAASAGEGTVTVPFGTSYTGTPIVVVSPASLNAQQGGHITGYYVTPSSANFILHVNDDGTGVTSAVFDYIVIH